MKTKNHGIIFIVLCSLFPITLFGMDNNPQQDPNPQQQGPNPQQQAQPQQNTQYTVKSKYAFSPNQPAPNELINLWKAETDAVKARNSLSTHIIDSATSGVSSGFGTGMGTGIGTTIVHFISPFIKISHNLILGTSSYKKQLEKLSVEKKLIHDDITMLLNETRAITEEITILKQQHNGTNKDTIERLKKLFEQMTQSSINRENLKKRELANQSQIDKLNQEYQPTQPLYYRLTGWVQSKLPSPQSKKPQTNKNTQKQANNQQSTPQKQPVQGPNPAPAQAGNNKVPAPQPGNGKTPNPVPAQTNDNKTPPVSQPNNNVQKPTNNPQPTPQKQPGQAPNPVPAQAGNNNTPTPQPGNGKTPTPIPAQPGNNKK